MTCAVQENLRFWRSKRNYTDHIVEDEWKSLIWWNRLAWFFLVISCFKINLNPIFILDNYYIKFCKFCSRPNAEDNCFLNKIIEIMCFGEFIIKRVIFETNFISKTHSLCKVQLFRNKVFCNFIYLTSGVRWLSQQGGASIFLKLFSKGGRDKLLKMLNKLF